MCPSLHPRCSVSFWLAAGLAISRRRWTSEAWTSPKGFVMGPQPAYRPSVTFTFSLLSVQSPTVVPALGVVPRGTGFGRVDAFAINTPQPNLLLLVFHSAGFCTCCKPLVGRCCVCVMKGGLQPNLHLPHRAA